jgi:plasmid maintenance system antidote protein VapI
MSNKNERKYDSFDSFEGFFQQAEESLTYWVERAKLEFTEEVVARMEELGVTKTELAQRLEAKPAFVTRLLSGGNNFELTTMVRLARALESDFCCHLQPKGTNSLWLTVLNEDSPVAVWNPSEFQVINVDFDRKGVNAAIPVAA